MIKKNNKKIFILIALFWSLPFLSKASEIEINTTSSNYDLKDVFVVDFFLDTRSESINALSGVIEVDQKLSIVDVFDADSVVNFWVDKSFSNNNFSFAGIIPGGFRGTGGKIFSLVVKAEESGESLIIVRNSSVFLNDGLGTEYNVPSKDKVFYISSSLGKNTKAFDDFSFDKNPPESFRPEVSRSDSLFDGKWFLVFDTEDKDSGISHYLLKESKWKIQMFFKRWAIVESPYLLADQNRTSLISIKAVDKAGNETIVHLDSQNKKSTISTFIFISGIILILLVFGFLVVKITKFLVKRSID
jgi:hypothetical protein